MVWRETAHLSPQISPHNGAPAGFTRRRTNLKSLGCTVGCSGLVAACPAAIPGLPRQAAPSWLDPASRRARSCVGRAATHPVPVLLGHRSCCAGANRCQQPCRQRPQPDAASSAPGHQPVLWKACSSPESRREPQRRWGTECPLLLPDGDGAAMQNEGAAVLRQTILTPVTEAR